MKLAIDFDGVLAHTMKGWVEKYNSLIDSPITLRDIDMWAFFEKWGMDWPQALDIFKMTWNDPDNLEPMEHHLNQKVKMLRKFGQVDIITSVDPSCESSIKYWLDQQQIEYDNLCVVKGKAELDYDIFIDDSPDNAINIFTAGKSVLLYNQPWNRNIPNSYYNDKVDASKSMNVTRIYNLYHAIDIIRERYE